MSPFKGCNNSHVAMPTGTISVVLNRINCFNCGFIKQRKEIKGKESLDNDTSSSSPSNNKKESQEYGTKVSCLNEISSFSHASPLISLLVPTPPHPLSLLPTKALFM
jgi:hypothetical protein